MPRSTEFNRRIPKQKFYERLTISPRLKRFITEQIRVICWRNKIAPSTTNLAAGQSVEELQVFEIRLNQPSLDESVLRQMDREIPYHILYLLEFSGKYQAWIAYKEKAGSGSAAFKIHQYYHTDWMEENQLPLRLEGLNMDAVYENFVRRIAGNALPAAAPGESLKEAVSRSQLMDRLKGRIESLLSKIRKEKQLNRQMEMNAQLRKLKKEWEALCDE